MTIDQLIITLQEQATKHQRAGIQFVVLRNDGGEGWVSERVSFGDVAVYDGEDLQIRLVHPHQHKSFLAMTDLP